MKAQDQERLMMAVNNEMVDLPPEIETKLLSSSKDDKTFSRHMILTQQ